MAFNDSIVFRAWSRLSNIFANANNVKLTFAACGAANSFVYLVFMIYFKNFYFVWLQSSRNFSNVILIPGLAIALFLYCKAYKLLQNHPAIGIFPILVWALVAASFALFTPSFYSSDVLSYINYGWQQAKYNVNPYCLLLAGTKGFGSDPMFTAVWALTPPAYGFAFEFFSKIICQFGEGNLGRTIALFKAVNVVAWLLVGGAVYKGAQLFRLPRPDLSLYLFLWSPLVLVHSISCAHNDLLMTLYVMAAFLCALSSIATVSILALPLLVTGILIKYVWAFSVPFLMLYQFRKTSLLSVLFGLFAGSATFLTWFWSYRCNWREVRWREMSYNLTLSANSLTAVVENIGRAVKRFNFQLEWFDVNLICSNLGIALRISFFAAFIVLSFMLFLSALRKGDKFTGSQLIQFSLLGVMVAICLISAKFYPWYVIMFYPVALWLPESNKLRQFALTLSCTQLFALTFVGHGHVNNFLLLTLLPFLICVFRWCSSAKKRSLNALDYDSK